MDVKFSNEINCVLIASHVFTQNSYFKTLTNDIILLFILQNHDKDVVCLFKNMNELENTRFILLKKVFQQERVKRETLPLFDDEIILTIHKVLKKYGEVCIINYTNELLKTSKIEQKYGL